MLDQYEYILFDWDGTLVKSLDRWHDALRVSLENKGYDLTAKEIGANYESFRDRAGSLGIVNVDKVIEAAHDHLDSQPRQALLYDGVKSVLTDLYVAGKKLAIVTTSTHDQVDPLLKVFGIAKYFDVVICGDDVINIKPHAEPIELAIYKLGGLKNQTVIVGDSSADILAANSAGIDSILYFPQKHEIYYDLQELKNLNPTQIVDSLKTLITI